MSVANSFAEIRAWLAWAPDWVTAAALIVIAIVAALGIHAVAYAALRRAIPERQVFLRTLATRTRAPTRLAVILFMAGSVLPVAPLPAEAVSNLQHGLLIAVVVLLGWGAVIALQVASQLYLSRFQIEAEDNLIARKHATQIRVLERASKFLIVVFTVAGVLMTFEPVRQYGVSIFASAGVAGLVVGLAARPALSNLVAGLQIAIAQPIRIDDVVIVEGEWGRIEDITSTYVVVRIWDLRRLIVPLSHFVEKPFENWTRENASLLAPILLYLDYSAPVGALREKVDEILEGNKLWDGKVKNVQVTDARESTIEVRVLLSAANSGDAWNLRCDVREQLIALLQEEYPQALPRRRNEVVAPVAVESAEPQKAERRPETTSARPAG